MCPHHVWVKIWGMGVTHAPPRIPTTQATPCEVGLDFEYGIPVLCTGMPLFVWIDFRCGIPDVSSRMPKSLTGIFEHSVPEGASKITEVDFMYVMTCVF